ncbi:hypothetical protein [Clostridium oryzae]|uniref:hypothetical protein n=1 Tax=Clostridium oryzae TaxID=1450648 RepID=UPI001FA878EB|nr:hypothetical protein [Clostridium oryzae]
MITLFNQYPKSITILQKQLIALIVFFVATWCTGIFIKLFIKKLDSSQIHICNSNIKKAQSGVIINESGNVIKTISQEAKNGGFIIGILERIFIIVSILMNYSVVIGFVLTAKSFARLSKLSDESFAEYFIIGNLMSFISAILGGILLKSMFGL